MIYVFLANGCEEVEALTPVDILRRAERDVRTVGVGGKTVTGSHGIPIVCDLTEDEVIPGEMEMVVLPGGMPGTLNLEKSEIVRSVIQYAAETGKWVAAICAAPSILGHMGLLKGRSATCYPGFEDQLDAKVSEGPVCVDGKFVTARGMGVSVEFGLKLVELLTDTARSRKLAASLQCAR